ncbi:hypothetical protein ASD82_11335 [Rhodanobacter sp. Root179]|nr:hypothetical protein ASD82_11335 [Rhodanobacter sp. Root179]
MIDGCVPRQPSHEVAPRFSATANKICALPLFFVGQCRKHGVEWVFSEACNPSVDRSQRLSIDNRAFLNKLVDEAADEHTFRRDLEIGCMACGALTGISEGNEPTAIERERLVQIWFW